MSSYLLLLGNTPDLSLAEIKAVKFDRQLERWSQHLVKLGLKDDAEAQQLQQVLGGVFKIIKTIKKIDKNPEQAKQQIADFLLEQKQDKIEFGLGSVDQTQLEIDPSEIKQILKTQKQKARFRRGSQWGLSAAILTHEPQTFDLLIVENEEKLYLTQTVAFQDLEEWIARDRHKPFVSPHKGMLPPKLARILVNLALGHLPQKPASPILYDPFCGTGTILIEALLRGCQVIGSDIDQKSVAGTLENLYWAEDYYQQQFQYQVFQAEVAHADQFDWQASPELIVTEPFLGKPNPQIHELDNIFTGLESLYLGAFKTWANILKSQAVVSIIFPQAKTQYKTYNLLHLIDKLDKYGYTLSVKPIDYGYEKAVISRQILVFEYSK
jgi:tRNA G10  N-methylase Trm11